MAGRIRSIKPELLEDAIAAGLSSDAFRLFIGMILLSDDHGNIRAEPAWLEGQVFWKRRNIVPMAEMFCELSSLVLLYEHRGQKYGIIRNWNKHQKVDRPGKPRITVPSEILARLSRDPRDILATDHGPDPDLDPDLDPSQRESLRGGQGSDDGDQSGVSLHSLPLEEAPRVDILEPKLLVDVSVTPNVFEAFSRAFQEVTGKKPVIPYERSFQRELIRICAQHSNGLSGNELIDWTRAKAEEAARNGAQPTVFAFSSFLNRSMASQIENASESIYGAAIAKGRKGGYSCPQGSEALLRAIFRDQGFHADGRRVAPERFSEWLAVEAENFAEWLTDRIKREPKAALWYSNYDPKGFQKRLNEIGLEEAKAREDAPILEATQ